MNKALITLTLFFAVTCLSFAESSLSARGYGSQFETSSARSAGMGLAGIGVSDSLSLDLFNPANWTGARTARFGFNSFMSQKSVSDNTGTDAGDNGSIGGIGFVVPTGRTAFLGFSMTPLTMMDYRWRSEGTSPWSSTLTRRQGQGGLSQVLIGGSMQINDRLRLGLAVRPIFGKVERLWKLDYPDGGAYSASQTISDRFSGYGFSISSRWQENGWGAGLVLNTPVSVTVQRQLLVVSAGTAMVDSTYELGEQYDLPLDIGIGISRQFSRNLFALDAVLHNWGAVDPPSIEGGSFENSYRISAGWEMTSDYQPLDPFWKSLIYRGGFYTSNSYGISASGHQAAEFGITCGLGIPYAKGRSRLDLAFEFGWEGNKTDDGAAERTLGFTIGFNHSEIWFLGRRERE